MSEYLREQYNKEGYLHLHSFFDRAEVEAIRQDARQVFIRLLRFRGLFSGPSSDEAAFETAMKAFFEQDREGFFNCGKTCQHMISLHRLSLDDKLIGLVRSLGLSSPVICTRPVIYFNSRRLAKSEVHYRMPAHQDWRSMQGSINALVVWIPLIDIPRELGALEIVPRSHLWGLLDSAPDDWYRHVHDEAQYPFESVETRAGDALAFSAFLLHRSGDNVTDSIRWSCHFRYNDLDEASFIERHYPHPYLYKPMQELIRPDFPVAERLQTVFQRTT